MPRRHGDHERPDGKPRGRSRSAHRLDPEERRKDERLGADEPSLDTASANTGRALDTEPREPASHAGRPAFADDRGTAADVDEAGRYRNADSEPGARARSDADEGDERRADDRRPDPNRRGAPDSRDGYDDDDRRSEHDTGSRQRP